MMYNVYWYNFNITDSWCNMYFTYTLIDSIKKISSVMVTEYLKVC